MADAVAEDKRMLVLGLPYPAYVIFGVEFAERLGYYAVAFSLFTYGRHMLGISAGGMQAIMNSIYLVVPAAACASSGLADTTWGRARTLMTFLVAYAAGLALLTVSSLPGMYSDFPEGPETWSYILFALALCAFAVGYGGMKVCTNPMMADSVTATYTRLFALEQDQHQEHARGRMQAEDSHSPGEYGTWGGTGDQAATPSARDDVRVVVHEPSADASASPTSPAFLVAGDVTGDVVEAQKAELERVLSRAFNFVYWVSNFGSLFGIFAAPLMRSWDSRHIMFGSDEYTSGYYYGFATATVSVLVGLLFFAYFRRQFPRNEPAPLFLFFRLMARAVRVRLWFALGKIHDPAFQAAAQDLLAYGVYHGRATAGNEDSVVVMDTSSAAHQTADTTNHFSAAGVQSHLQQSREELDDAAVGDGAAASPGTHSDQEGGGSQPAANAHAQYLEDCRTTLRVCKAFVALPIYWLITNQYSTTLMFSLEALDLPPSIPPDLFNNINTFTLLLFIALCDRVIYPHFFFKKNHGRGPSPRSRIVCGFLLVVASMIWCGVVQVAIAHRGHYVGAEGIYEVYPQRSQLSAGWLVVPYILQGMAAALVDPASMEVAYTGAPGHMKATVMALYWVASSASGFLGLILSPVMKPNNGVALYFGFATALLLVTGLFYFLNYSGAYVNATLDAVERELVRKAAGRGGGGGVGTGGERNIGGEVGDGIAADSSPSWNATPTPPPQALQHVREGEASPDGASLMDGAGGVTVGGRDRSVQGAYEQARHLRIMAESDDPYEPQLTKTIR